MEHELARAYSSNPDVDSDLPDQIINVMNSFSDRVETLDYPVDGLVVASDDYKTADALPVTGHHPNRLTGFAFKWADECVETTLREIEWSPSRTGRINPVAVFDPVQLEGTTVTRASVHNVSIVKKLRLRVGDKISVFKANKIIPCIDKNLTPGDELTYAESHACTCPVCGMETSPMITHSGDRDVEVEMCTNPNCAVKQVKKFVHFCERDCMDIVGLSEKTLEKFIEKGFIKQLADLYRLDTFERNIAAMDGFGQKSYDNIWKSIQISRKTTFVPFIHALGIPMVGKGQAKLFDKAYKGNVKKFFNDVYNRKTFTDIDGIGEKLSSVSGTGAAGILDGFHLRRICWMRCGESQITPRFMTCSDGLMSRFQQKQMYLLAKIFFPAKRLPLPAQSITLRTVQNCRRKLKKWVAKRLDL